MTINTNEVWEPVRRVIEHAGLEYAEAVTIGGQFGKLVVEIERLQETIDCVHDLMKDDYNEGDWVAFDAIRSEATLHDENID